MGSLATWYTQFYRPAHFRPAHPLALAALESGGDVRVRRQEGWIVLEPAAGEPRVGLIFYPGGDVAPEGYAEPLRALAAAGLRVVLVPMLLDLAVLTPDRAEPIPAAFPGVEHWVIGGHSLGGAMAARYVHRHPGAMDGLLLWDAYPPATDDLSRAGTPVAQLYRLEDGEVPPAYQSADALLPADRLRVPLPGAAHLNYGRFLPTARPREPASVEPVAPTMPVPTMPLEEQHARIVAASLAFMEGIAARAAPP